MQPAAHTLLGLAVLAVVSLSAVEATYYCKRPSSIANGGHNGGRYWYYRVGYVIKYWCNNGYTLQGSSQRICSYSRSSRSYYWSGTAPSCVANNLRVDSLRDEDSEDSSSAGWGSVYCSSLSSISYGYVTYYSRRPGAIAKYSCRSGYTLDGNVYRKCLSTGQWSGTQPACKGNAVCPDLSNPQNGYVKFTEGKGVGAEVWYVCNAGYRLAGSESRRCGSDLNWGGDAPKCVAKGCNAPDRPENGWVKYRYTTVGAQAWYYCNRGYTRVGSESRTCKSSGKWEPELPVCKRPGCDELVSPANGRVTYTSTSIGSYAVYVCNTGYSLVGVTLRKCEASGWTDEAPICKPLVCKDLPPLEYGSIKLSDGNRLHSVATHSCDSGYYFKSGHGDARRVCEDGRWSGSPPLCIPIDCGPLPAPQDGSVRITSTKFGATATYVCNNGFTLSGDRTRTCLESGQWSGAAPTCELRVHCPTLTDPPNGNVNQKSNRPGDRATYSCNTNYVISGDRTRTCQNDGSWSGEAPTCERLVQCSDLSNPSNGRVSQGGNRPGDRASYFCNSNYELVGSSSRTCQNDGSWSGVAPTCKRIIRCSDLSNPSNGRVSQGGNRPGDRASYFCDSNYELVGSSSRTCQNDGSWSGGAPTCRRIVRCSDLPNPSNGRVSQGGNRPGDRASYFCNSNYELVGSPSRTCQNDGSWSGDAPTCERTIRCSDLSDPSNGRVSQGGNRPGDRASYFCNSNYELVGSSSRTCQNDGSWSGNAPTCRRIVRCSDLPNPSNGRVSQGGNRPGNRASYFCNSNYELVGSPSRTCQNDGSWSGDAPTCRRIIRCSDLFNPSNGRVSQGGNRPGDRASYFCDINYRLIGEPSRTCQNDGSWSGNAPTCERQVRCSNLSAPFNGRVSQEGNRPGDRAVYSCNIHYELSGDRTRICQNDGSWSGSAPTCTRIVCASLSNPANGQVTFSSGVFVGSRATYTCDSGYFIVGDSSRTCQMDGSWSGIAPICRIIQCGRLNNPSNGQVFIRDDTVGGIANYSCNSGYNLVGSETRFCQNDGSWSGNAPVCEQQIVCSTLLAPSNGRVNQRGNQPGDTVTYSCNTNYELSGARTRICQNDGSWSGRAPTCTRIVCSNLPNPGNGQITFSSGVFVGSRATYTCDSGYLISGQSTRTCQGDGTWTGTAPTCRIIRCGDLSNPSNGRVSISDNIVGGIATYRCNSGYSLDGSETRICQNDGSWSGNAPTCVRIVCSNLPNPANGQVTFSSGVSVGSRATYTCDSGYFIEGQSTRTCQTDGRWTGRAPFCRLIRCGRLSNPTNGRVTISEDTVGGRATYTCNSGYDLFGSRIRICQNDGSWSGDEPVCEIQVMCSTLPAPSNGRIDQEGNRPDDRATYSCNTNYELSGDRVRTCQNDGSWSGSAPTCDRIVCQSLSNPANGQVTFSSGVFVGSRATYTCDSGYFVDGQSTRTCQADGSWTGNAPICRIIRCGGLSNPSNGQVSISDNTVGGSATYTCNSGYNLVGSETRFCQNDGSWSGDAPVCERQIICSTLSAPSNGRVDQRGNQPGDTATYSCNTNYELAGDRTRICQNDGSWSGSAPTCTRIVCASLSNPANGQVTFSSGVFVGSRATYTCDSGYIIVGDRSRTCQADGSWTGRAPICRIIRCSGLSNPSNGRVNIKDNTVGGEASYSCNSGYNLVGSETRICQNDGSWSGNVPTCNRIVCSSLPNPTNGQVTFSSGVFVGSRATYTCNSGYFIEGQSTRTCQGDGSWTGTAPICRIIRCGGLSNPSNGRVSISDNTVGGIATYRCNSGYDLFGSETRFCQNDGSWSGDAPVCELQIMCSNLPAPSNGRVEQRGNQPGDTAAYSCNTNYELSGDRTRTCQNDGSWSGSAPTCTRIVCSNLPNPSNGQVTFSSGVFVGSRAIYTCDSGYFIDGQRTRTCQADGSWTGSAPTCRIIRCGRLNNPSNGRVSISDNTVGGSATYTCNSGYNLVGSERRFCQNDGSWSGDAPVCERQIICSTLSAPSNGGVDQRGNQPGDTATYSCNTNYELAGARTRVCQTDGSWSGSAPTCTRIVCSNLPNPTNGQVSFSSGVFIGSTATYTCDSGYFIVGENTRTCQEDGSWSGRAPICRIIRCGGLNSPINGRVSISDNTVGGIATYTCNSGYSLSGSGTRICQNDGSWSGSTPTCSRVVCSSLSNPTNGRVTFSSGVFVGSRATYTCDTGYFIIGEDMRTCQTDGTWSGIAPSCRIIRCVGLSSPSNGQVFISEDTVGGIATYRCNSGYDLFGSETRICQNDGSWSGDAPVCELQVMCSNLPAPSNGRVDQRGNQPRDTATYFCNTNYELSGDRTRICQNDGSWSGSAPTCTRIVCASLPNPSNGQVTFSSGVFVGSRATYTCNNGYFIDGQSTRTCQGDGSWTGSAPICRIIRCGGLSNPSNGRVSITDNTVGGRATYTCNSGYDLVGIEIRYCQNDGSWSGDAPVCEQQITCSTLPAPSNGRVDQRGDQPGDTATYSCNTNYELSGDRTRICQNDGSWSGSAPTCTRTVCASLSNPANGQVIFSSGVFVGSRATYTCDSGYIIVGDRSRICQADGTWSGRAPTCRIIRCGGLRNPSNGQVSISNNTVGGRATYRCNSGYNLVGSETRFCQNDGSWSGDAPVCERQIVCSTLTAPSNGRVDQSGNRPGDTATYFCNTDYDLSGDRTRICQNDGSWSGNAPTCIRVVCQSLSNPTNGQVTFSSGVFVGSRAIYTCNSGYFIDGQSTRTCQGDGSWTGTAPICRIIRCGGLSNPSNGRVSITNDIPGSTATYTCNSGYTLVGRDTRTCQDDGSWSGTSPICRRVRCNELPSISNGQVTFSSEIIFPGSTATYACVIGYRLVGSATRTCQETGQWSGQVPFCRLVECGNLANPRNGRVDLTGTTFGSTAIYSCNQDYMLEGPQSRMCQADGTWSRREPTCQRDVFDCGTLNDPENGSVDLSDGTTEGSDATYTCFAGYQLKGVTTRTCSRSGWSATEPTCEPVDCGTLDAPGVGQVSWTSTFLGGIATYSCFTGYVLDGQAQRTCEANGFWSGQPPVCRPVDCGLLEDPANGRVSFTLTTFQITVTYSCNPGFELVGDVQRVCTAEAVWSGAAPVCQPTTQCPQIPTPTNGQVVVPSRIVGSVATYICFSGYTIQGSDQRTCQADGTWSGTPPFCILIDICSELTGPANGEVVLSGLTLGSQATYSCIAGYELVGNMIRECQVSGTWTGSEPFCRSIDCGRLNSRANGAVDFSRTTFGAMAFYSCNAGYFLQGFSKRTCQANGLWSNSEPTCELEAQCTALENPNNGVVTTTGQRPGDLASYSCNEGYILQGDDTRVCQNSGVWSGDAPTCTAVDCGPLSDPINGQVTVFETTLGAPAIYICSPGYELVGAERRLCTSTGQWSDQEPFCIPVVCPVLTNPVNGIVFFTDNSFNSVATYSCNDGFVLNGNRQRTCLETGQWSGQEPACITPQPSCGDPGAPSNGRRIGEVFSTGSAVFFRCSDDYDIVGSKYRVCQEGGVWSGTQPTCRPFNDTCPENAKDIENDRCGRRCQCVNGKLINCCRVRKDYVGLTEEERQIYINTFLAMTRDPIYRARYNTLVKLYKDSFTANNITQSGVAAESQYFAFNRYFLLEYEDLLKDFDCRVTVPFYDWTPFPVAPYTAAVWNNTHGFGDSARAEDKCVITGPVRAGEYSIAPSAGGGCLQREYTNRRFPSRDIINRDVLTYPADEFANFHQMLQLLIGLNVQCFIGGTICSADAANDPVFLLHLAQLDSILTRWQLFGQGRDKVRYASDNRPLLLTPGFTVSQFSSNLNLPYDNCILYDPPVLLKNHDAPPRSPATLAFSPSAVQAASAILPEEKRMDCASSSAMGYMDTLMSKENHDFMKEECDKRRPIV